MLAKRLSPEIGKVLRHDPSVADGLFCHHWEKSKIRTNMHIKKEEKIGGKFLQPAIHKSSLTSGLHSYEKIKILTSVNISC